MGKKILGLPAPSLLSRGWWWWQVTSLTSTLTSVLSTQIFFLVYVLIIYTGGGALCYLGAGRQLHTSQVKTELKTKPHSKLNTRVLQGLSMTPFLPPFPPSQGVPP